MKQPIKIYTVKHTNAFEGFKQTQDGRVINEELGVRLRLQGDGVKTPQYIIDKIDKKLTSKTKYTASNLQKIEKGKTHSAFYSSSDISGEDVEKDVCWSVRISLPTEKDKNKNKECCVIL